jgi:uncharacterized protein YegP (UPF0339 family)
MVFEVYTDAAGHHLWRLKRKLNNEVMAVSARAYANRQDCVKSILVVKNLPVDTPVIDLSPPPN